MTYHSPLCMAPTPNCFDSRKREIYVRRRMSGGVPRTIRSSFSRMYSPVLRSMCPLWRGSVPIRQILSKTAAARKKEQDRARGDGSGEDHSGQDTDARDGGEQDVSQDPCVRQERRHRRQPKGDTNSRVRANERHIPAARVTNLSAAVASDAARIDEFALRVPVRGRTLRIPGSNSARHSGSNHCQEFTRISMDFSLAVSLATHPIVSGVLP